MYDIETLLSNQVLVGLSGASLLAGALWFARSLVAAGVRSLRARWTVTFEVSNDDTAFDWIVAWLDELPQARRVRRLTLTFYSNNGPPRAIREAPESGAGNARKRRETPQYRFSPGPGLHWFVHSGVFMLLSRTREKSQNGGRPHETLTFTAFTRDLGYARRVVEEAFAAYNRDDELVSVSRHGTYNAGWTSACRIRPRRLDSVVLAEGVREALVADVDRFLEREQWYTQRGIPWRRGYLLSGPPGTGKTSVIEAIAGRLRADLFILTPASVTSDNELARLTSEVPAGAILLVEDIDVALSMPRRPMEVETYTIDPLAGETRREKELGQRGITFSGLLNAIDGIGAGSGRILFLTTNRPDALDPALTRPGRCDEHFRLGYVTRQQAEALYRLFFPDAPTRLASALANQVGDDHVVPVQLQAHFLNHIDDPEAAARMMPRLAIAGGER